MKNAWHTTGNEKLYSDVFLINELNEKIYFERCWIKNLHKNLNKTKTTQ